MTRAELAKWLGVPEDKPIHPGIVSDMEAVPFPADDQGQIDAFGEFLESCNRHGIKP